MTIDFTLIFGVLLILALVSFGLFIVRHYIQKANSEKAIIRKLDKIIDLLEKDKTKF